VNFFFSFLWIAVGLMGLSGPLSPQAQGLPPAPLTARVKLGVDHLQDLDFKPLKGKNVGLLTNPAGVSRSQETTLSLFKKIPEIRLVALFGPEHGIDGKSKANETVQNNRDPQLNIPIYSLYGPTRRPTAEMLKGIDVMVVDLQDIGSRSYTYVTCLCYVMEEAFKRNIHVMVLDRPNPLGGEIVDGPGLDLQWKSYVGYLPTPYVHGLTIGELAKMALYEGWLDLPKDKLNQAKKGNWLTVIPMKGWKRSFTWKQTGLPWVPPSPNITTSEAALGYAMTGLGAQIGIPTGAFRHGIGTPYPFRFLTYTGKTASELKAALESFQLTGLHFQRMVLPPNAKEGVYISLKSWKTFKPTRLSLVMMALLKEWSAPKNPFTLASPQEAELFNKHTGSSALWEALCSPQPLDLQTFFNQWDMAALQFKALSRKYYLYK
jgi:uncharacterized protein YbbC (DUF1343 family)